MIFRKKYGRFFGHNPHNKKPARGGLSKHYDGIFLHSFQPNGFSIVSGRPHVNSYCRYNIDVSLS